MNEDLKILKFSFIGFFLVLVLMLGFVTIDTYQANHKPPTQCRIDGATK